MARKSGAVAHRGPCDSPAGRPYDRAAVAAALRREGIRASHGADAWREVADQAAGGPDCTYEQPALPRVPPGTDQAEERALLRRLHRRYDAQVRQSQRRCGCASCSARLALSRASDEADQLYQAAEELETCGRARVKLECAPHGEAHAPHYTLRRCRIAPVCPDCARLEARRLADLYGARIKDAMAAAPAGVRPRMVTLSRKPRETEEPEAAMAECMRAAKDTLQIVFGVPQDARQWRLFFQLERRTLERLVAREPTATAAGRRRSPAARERAARTELRRHTTHDRRRRGAGWIVATEFGELGLKAHAHAMVLGRYVPWVKLRAAWKLCSGQSFIADIREGWNVKEVVKYAAKFTNRSPEQIAQVYRALVARRRVESFGVLRGRCLAERTGALAPPPVVCAMCGGDMKPVGLISPVEWDAGIRSPPQDRRFRRHRS